MGNKRVLLDRQVLIEEVQVKGKEFPVYFNRETEMFEVDVDGKIVESSTYGELIYDIERIIPSEIIGWVPLIKIRFMNGVLSTFEKVQAAKVEHTSISILYDWVKWHKLAKVDLNQVPFSYTVTVDGVTTVDFTVPYSDELWMECKRTQTKMKLLGDELKKHIFASEAINEFGNKGNDPEYLPNQSVDGV